jgi:hypothetical protein
MYVEAVKFANHKPGLKGEAEVTMVSGSQRISNNGRLLMDSRFFRFLILFLTCIKNKYKIVYIFMVLCSESKVLEVIIPMI